MESVYSFDYGKFLKLFDELYPMTGLKNNMDFSNLSMKNFETLRSCFEKIINNPVLKDKTIYIREKEEITCLDDETKKIFDTLFDNEDLMIYGHGGAGKKIIESEGLKCRYPNLGSHFIPLSKTNKSLEKLNAWPHREASEIAILALNTTEYNPIYQQREAKNIYDTDIYTLDNSYFVGYYDAKSKKFYANPNFKLEHSYNEKNTLYVDETERFSNKYPNTEDENVNEFFKYLNKIKNVLLFSSFRNLNEKGYLSVKEALNKYMEKASDIQKHFTDEYLKGLNESKNKNNNVSQPEIFDLDNFEFIEWEDADSKTR